MIDSPPNCGPIWPKFLVYVHTFLTPWQALDPQNDAKIEFYAQNYIGNEYLTLVYEVKIFGKSNIRHPNLKGTISKGHKCNVVNMYNLKNDSKHEIQHIFVVQEVCKDYSILLDVLKGSVN